MLFFDLLVLPLIYPNAQHFATSDVCTTALHAVKTGATTVHTYETMSGLQFALYTSNDVLTTKTSERMDYTSSETIFARDALRHIYSNVWVECVIRSPMYVPGNANIDVTSTTFENELDAYLKSLPWFQ